MEHIAELFEFIEESKSAFHAVQTAKKRLQAAGFVPLQEQDCWNIVPEGKYYVTRNLSSIIAFVVPSTGFAPMMITASHSDSPTFKIKENGVITVQNQYNKLNTEGYGGMLCSTWFDRPLSVAGRLLVKTDTGVKTCLVDIDRDLLVIPSVAIHMNREANSGYKYNAQIDMAPLLGASKENRSLMALLSQQADVPEQDILASDLFLYTRMKGTKLGANHEYIMAPRLDDLACGYATLEGFLGASPKNLAVWTMFDNEEVGSTTKQGACSTFFADTLKRICTALGGTHEDYLRALASSLLVSADNAHAVHPNHPELSDASNAVYLNEGVVLKYNANQKYTTDAVSAALFRTVCAHAGVQLQAFANRSDMPGGSTLGNLSNTQVSINAVDIGLPQLAMHSAVETAGAQDVEDMVKAVQTFYNTAFTAQEDGALSITI